MRSVFRAAALAACILLVFGGCDSSDDDDEPQENFVGTWTVTRIDVGSTNILPLLNTFAGVSGVGATFESAGAFVVVLQTSQGPVETNGTYSFDSQNKVLVLNSDSFEAPIEVTYAFSGDTLELSSADAAVIAELAGLDLSEILPPGNVVIRFRREQ